MKLSSYVIDPTAAYENKQNWKSALHASAGLIIDVLKELSDAFTPLKFVVGGLSAILKHSVVLNRNLKNVRDVPRFDLRLFSRLV